MSVPDTDLPPHWLYYSDRAREAHDGRADDLGQGREEQLNETLLLIESGKSFTEAERKRLDNLPRNRAQKHTRLRNRTEQQAVVRHPRLGTISLKFSVISYQDDQEPVIDRVFALVAPGEWKIECRLAEGETYAEVADGISPATLKMRVSRWRARVREAVAV